MRIPNTLLLKYQAEYENTPDLTINQMCKSYDISTKQLPGYTKWTKRTCSTIPTNLSDDNLVKPSINDSISEFKDLAMAHALKFMHNDAEFAEVKEFKDMVSIVGTIEASLKDNKPDNVINIAIQNIVKDFKDDC